MSLDKENILFSTILDVAAATLSNIDVKTCTKDEAAKILGVPAHDMEAFTNVWNSYKSMWEVDTQMQEDIKIAAEVFLSLMLDNLPPV